MSQPGGPGAGVPKTPRSNIISASTVVKSSQCTQIHNSHRTAFFSRKSLESFQHKAERKSDGELLSEPLLAADRACVQGGWTLEGLFARPAFSGFGPMGLRPESESPHLHTIKARRPGRLRALLRQDCPRLPGVYGMIDPRGELIYVGKAKNLRARLLSYFRPRSRDPKAGRILKRTRSLVAHRP